MLDFLEGVAVACQKLVVLWPALDRARFSTEGANIELLFRAGIEKALVELPGQPGFTGHSSKGFVTTGQGALGRFDAHFMDLLLCLVGGFLHHAA